tara:strand:+ start:335 stop:544 length:210 start_codon:yes stop_codon:yes gene_type:complete
MDSLAAVVAALHGLLKAVTVVTVVVAMAEMGVMLPILRQRAEMELQILVVAVEVPNFTARGAELVVLVL